MSTLQHSNWVNDARFSTDGKHLVTTSNDATVKIWEFDGKWLEKATIQLSCLGYLTRISPDGNYLLTVSRDEKIVKIWKFDDGQFQITNTIRHSDCVIRANFSSDGNYLVTSCLLEPVKIYKLVDGQWRENGTIQVYGLVVAASFSPDGNCLVIAGNGTAIIGEVVDGQYQIRTVLMQSVNLSVSEANFSPDGNHLVIVCSDKTAKIWGLVDGQWQKKATIEHSEEVHDARFSPDGNHLVTTSIDKTAQIWGLVDRQWRKKTTIHPQNITTLSVSANFSPDGRHLVILGGVSVNIWMLKNNEKNNE